MPSRNFASRRTASCLRKSWIMDCASVFMLVGWAAKSGDASRSVEAKQMSVFIRLGRQGIDGSTSHQNSSVQPLIEVFAHELLIYSTVTLLARLRGLSTSQPRAMAMW